MAQLIQARNDSHIISPGHAPNAPLIQASAPPPIQYRVTGDDPNNRPDDRSVWNERTGRWERGTAAYANWRDDLGAQRRGELDAASDQRKLANWKEMFSTRQRAEIDALNNARDEILASDRYSDADKKAMLAQIDAKKWGIQPVTRPKTPGEIDEENFNVKDYIGKYTSTDANGNLLGVNPRTGEVRVIAGAPKSQPDAVAEEYNSARTANLKARDEAFKAYVREMNQADGPLGKATPKYTREEALALAQKDADALYPLPQFRTSAEKERAEEAARNMGAKIQSGLSAAGSAFRNLGKNLGGMLMAPQPGQPAAPQPQAQPQPADAALLNPGLADATDFGPGAAQPIPVAPGGPTAPDSQVLQPMAQQPAADEDGPQTIVADVVPEEDWMKKAKSKGWLVQQ